MGFLSNLFNKTDDNDLSKAIQEGAYLVDVRTPMEFSMGSVAGAVNIPLDTIPGQLAKFRNKKNIIVFCKSGSRSRQAKSFLEQQGVQHILDGGSWQTVQHILIK